VETTAYLENLLQILNQNSLLAFHCTFNEDLQASSTGVKTKPQDNFNKKRSRGT